MTAQHMDPVMFALMLASLSLIPLLMMITTAFLKVVIVLMITRNAIGIQQVPPNMALYSIALAATLFIMAPVGYDMAQVAKKAPLDFTSVDKLTGSAGAMIAPLTRFMQRNTDPEILNHLHDNALTLWPAHMTTNLQQDVPWLLIPAFVLSELKAGFHIGFIIYIPFIVIDLIVSNLLLALGMQMVAPMTLALPLKLLLFVLAQGWTRLLDGLFYSYL
ncbi:Type III secretion inner membrane protein (YscR,SpaR,HrcR,EscR) [Pseudomonas synxantha]|uniref:Type III secretion inner membrane protein (YscR,SpaR,HrcR,EscR) n=1 Tax=Pseudomonas synxantha TaxID=47883 RepID=A0A3G7UEB1_9PSED|nr:type III secretion system export apparatus subunit SctR [Pseudomonas synxantha]AZE56876.1 Type III secretion inner membrane protein (YscR,SpaR,HrcR,EscR) [Pseudomonas synxantha]